MGLILDSSVLVAAERQGHNARKMLASIARKIAETEVGISVVTPIELAHGAARADTPERKAKRHKFIEELLTAVPTHPVTVPLALRRTNRRREPSAGNPSSSSRSAHRRNRTRTRIQCGDGQSSPLPTAARSVHRGTLTQEKPFERSVLPTYNLRHCVCR